MRLIDAEKYREEWLKFRTFEPMLLIDQQPTVEAIPKAEYEARLKADMVAMLTEIQLEIEEHEESIIGHYGKETKESDFPSHKIERNNGRKECANLIQQKIDKLKGE